MSFSIFFYPLLDLTLVQPRYAIGLCTGRCRYRAILGLAIGCSRREGRISNEDLPLFEAFFDLCNCFGDQDAFILQALENLVDISFGAQMPFLRLPS